MPNDSAVPKLRRPPRPVINPPRPLVRLHVHPAGLKWFAGYVGLTVAFVFTVVVVSNEVWPTIVVAPAATGTYKPIRVDRSRMEELGMYDEPEWFDTEWMDQPEHQSQRIPGHPTAGPLLVTALPETKPPKHKYVSNAVADWRLCGRTDKPCRVVLVGSIGEQESKAQSHLQQIAVIARELDRTLVLPNMHKSRFGICSRNRFDTYYDIGSLQALGVHVAPYDAFLEWHATRRTPPVTQAIEVMAWEQQASYQSSAWKRCLWKAAPRIQWERNTVQIPISNSKNFISTGRSIVDRIHNDALATLSSHPNVHELDIPQVYAFDWKLRYPVVPEVQSSHLVYAAGITHYADNLLAAAGPIAVVHWRMESVPPENLVDCSKGLIGMFEWMLGPSRLKDVRVVYLATDYPLENDTVRHSGTFRDIGEQHHAAINTFQEAFQPGGALESYKQVSYFDLAQLVPRPENAPENDPGYHGIMDKVMASRADIFVGGSPQCTRNSSFTRQITMTRWRTVHYQLPSKARNVGYTFQPFSQIGRH